MTEQRATGILMEEHRGIERMLDVVEACERVEREEMGEREHERFHAMIEQLERQMAQAPA